MKAEEAPTDSFQELSDFRPQIYRDQIAQSLRRSIAEGEHGLGVVPGLIRRAIECKAWQERVVKVTGEAVSFGDFASFAIATPPHGLGVSRQTLLNLCHGHDGVQKKIKKAWPMTGKELADEPLPDGAGPGRGHTKTPDNIRSFPSYGTDPTYAEARLARDRPDLYEQVLAGEKSPHAAMVEAGFRPRTATFYPEDLKRTARVLLKHFDEEDAARLAQLLTKDEKGE